MKCHRCGGTMVFEKFYGIAEQFSGWRCIFCGEILDVFGPVGGHNFAWAWITGRAAGIGASEEPGGAGAGEEGAEDRN